MKMFLNKLINAFVYYSEKFNMLGGDSVDHAKTVLICFTILIQVSFLFPIIYSVGMGEDIAIVFVEAKFLAALVIFGVVSFNSYCWSKIIQFVYEESSYQYSILQKYYWRTIIFVTASFILGLVISPFILL